MRFRLYKNFKTLYTFKGSNYTILKLFLKLHSHVFEFLHYLIYKLNFIILFEISFENTMKFCDIRLQNISIFIYIYRLKLHDLNTVFEAELKFFRISTLSHLQTRFQHFLEIMWISMYFLCVFLCIFMMSDSTCIKNFLLIFWLQIHHFNTIFEEELNGVRIIALSNLQNRFCE